MPKYTNVYIHIYIFATGVHGIVLFGRRYFDLKLFDLAGSIICKEKFSTDLRNRRMFKSLKE